MQPYVVLVSDDEPFVIESLRRALRPFDITVIADTQSEVVELAERHQPDIVLLDLLQRRDGLALLQELKTRPSTRSISTLLMSGIAPDPSEHIVSAARRLGALDVIAKPFQEDFPERIATLARAFDLEVTLDDVAFCPPEVEVSLED
jgi:CheY-like chemotaxis protein